MDKRKLLIDMISEGDVSDINWWETNNIVFEPIDQPKHGWDPIYCEYQNLRHRLGLIGENDKNTDGYHAVEDGTLANDVGELAENNRAMWRRWIEKHRNNDILDGLL